MHAFLAWLGRFWDQNEGFLSLLVITIAGVVLTAVLALIVSQLRRRLDEKANDRKNQKAAMAAAAAKKVQADAWPAYMRRKAAERRTHLRWTLRWDPDLTTYWNLTNNGPGPVRNLQFAVQQGNNQSPITRLNELDLNTPMALELGDPEPTLSQVLLIRWDDDSGTNYEQQIPISL